MFIKDVNKSQNVSSSSKTKKFSSAGNFASYLSSTDKAAPSVVSGLSSLAFNDAILSTQFAHDEEKKEKKKQLIKRADSLIEKLEDMRECLLIGYIPRDMLVDISRFVKSQKIDAGDAVLSELVGEIELRVEVELAKLMR